MAACQSLDAASALLSANSFLIQTHGYARGSCRRLKHIREIVVKFTEPEQVEKVLDTASLGLLITCTRSCG